MQSVYSADQSSSFLYSLDLLLEWAKAFLPEFSFPYIETEYLANYVFQVAIDAFAK